MDEIDIETRINASLGKVLRYFNFLELNLGLCIRALENPKNPEKSHNKLARNGIAKNLQRLKELLESGDVISDKEEFAEWYNKACKTRCIRNYYVHGTWEYLPLRKDNPLGFRIPPWRTESLREESEETMNLDELETDAHQIQVVFEKFMDLRRKYGV